MFLSLSKQNKKREKFPEHFGFFLMLVQMFLSKKVDIKFSHFGTPITLCSFLMPARYGTPITLLVIFLYK